MDSKAVLLYGLDDQDVATRLITTNSRYLGREARTKFLDDHYIGNQHITVRVFPQIPFNGKPLGDDVIRFAGESTLCLEAIGRGLRYLLFFFDKAPSCVFQLHLIRLQSSEFTEFNYFQAAYIIRNLYLHAEMLEPEQFESSRTAPTLAAAWHKVIEYTSAPTMALARIDAMSGLEFEQYVGELLRRRGFEVEVTKGSGDFGIDVIATKQGVRYGVQVKRQTEKVSRNAVSDAVAGKMYHHCDRAMVVTNNYFHDSAIVLAHSTRCELVDRDILQEWIMESYKTS